MAQEGQYDSQSNIEIEDYEKEILAEREFAKIYGVAAGVSSVNGQSGDVVLTTSDLENTSDYQDGQQVTDAIDTAIAGKQDILTAGTGIDITNDVVSVDTTAIATQQDVTDEATARENADNGLQEQIDALIVSSDVIDVLGTYQDLLNYDIAHVKENDIIKVLQDSTHNNAMSYYKWEVINHVGSWVYVGSEGPYYTKSETNELLNSKQDVIVAANKLESDLVDDTNQTNLFVTAAEKQTWNAKLDSSALTNYVRNTDYATSSIAGVMKISSGYGAALTQNGELYAGEITYPQYQEGATNLFISKGTLENVIVGKDLINSSYHDSTKQDTTSQSLETTNKTIVGAINEVDRIAKGANQALSYGNYSTMITAFNALADDVYNVGQNVMIITLNVPDLWISGIESSSSTYTYTTDEAFVNALNTNGYVQVGYYKLSALETQKVDLTNYYTKSEITNLLIQKADIINTTTGEMGIATFNDGANNLPINSLITRIFPLQDGSGTASPTNIRNITRGWTQTTLHYSDADTSNDETITISWENEAGTIYGGILNVTTGVLTKTHTLVEFAVADMNNNENYPGWRDTGIGEIIGYGINKRITATMNVGNTFGTNTTGVSSTIYLPTSTYGLTQTQWQEQYPNLTVQIVVEYETPTTYQLTPHQLSTFLGTNNFWTNTGFTTVNYKADTKLYIDNKLS